MVSLPSRPRSRASLPHAGETSAPLPRGTRSVLPARLLYEPPPLAHFSGTGTLSAVAIPCATAVFSGAGTLSSVGAAVATAGFSGEGTFIVPTNETNAEFTGTGALSATAIPCTTAPFTGEGMLSAAVVASVTAEFSGAGTLSAPGIPAASAPFSGAGTLSAAATVFSASGMLKNGSTYSVPTTYTEIPGWVANTGSYPGSTLSGNGLVANGSKSNATVTATVQLTNSFNVSTQVRIMKGATVVVEGTATTGTTATASISGYSVTSGDVFTVQIKRPDFTNGVTVQANTPSLTIT